MEKSKSSEQQSGLCRAFPPPQWNNGDSMAMPLRSARIRPTMAACKPAAQTAADCRRQSVVTTGLVTRLRHLRRRRLRAAGRCSATAWRWAERVGAITPGAVPGVFAPTRLALRQSGSPAASTTQCHSLRPVKNFGRCAGHHSSAARGSLGGY